MHYLSEPRGVDGESALHLGAEGDKSAVVFSDPNIAPRVVDAKSEANLIDGKQIVLHREYLTDVRPADGHWRFLIVILS
jgi:hypothetical protein